MRYSSSILCTWAYTGQVTRIIWSTNHQVSSTPWQRQRELVNKCPRDSQLHSSGGGKKEVVMDVWQYFPSLRRPMEWFTARWAGTGVPVLCLFICLCLIYHLNQSISVQGFLAPDITLWDLSGCFLEWRTREESPNDEKSCMWSQKCQFMSGYMSAE